MLRHKNLLRKSLSWYSSLDNLKQVRPLGWHFLTRLQANRQVNPNETGNRGVSDIEVGSNRRDVHLKGFGFVRVFPNKTSFACDS